MGLTGQLMVDILRLIGRELVGRDDAHYFPRSHTTLAEHTLKCYSSYVAPVLQRVPYLKLHVWLEES